MVWTSRHWLQRQRILAQHDPSLPNLMHVLRPSLQETHIIHAHATSLRSTSFPPRLHQPLDRGVCVVRSQVSFLSYWLYRLLFKFNLYMVRTQNRMFVTVLNWLDYYLQNPELCFRLCPRNRIGPSRAFHSLGRAGPGRNFSGRAWYLIVGTNWTSHYVAHYYPVTLPANVLESDEELQLFVGILYSII